MKPIKALGEPRRDLAAHLPLAPLRDTSEAWPAKFGTYAGYIFKGYRIGGDGAPTFRYAVGDIEVEDTLRPAKNGKALRRSVLVRRQKSGSDAAWYFRGINTGGDVVPQTVVFKDSVAIIEEDRKSTR